jgi:MinD superfamily P-loop ATPase
MTERIEALALEKGARVTGRIPYDQTVTLAQVQALAVVEIGGPAAQAVRQVWKRFAIIGEANGATRRAAERAN